MEAATAADLTEAEVTVVARPESESRTAEVDREYTEEESEDIEDRSRSSAAIRLRSRRASSGSLFRERESGIRQRHANVILYSFGFLFKKGKR